MNFTVRPARQLKGEVVPPGDKSISHRALMLAAIAEGESVMRGLSKCRDVMSTISCLRALGADITVEEGKTMVAGRGLAGLTVPRKILYAGNSGTTARLISGMLAGQEFRSGITGDASLCARPMERVAAPLRLMGAVVKLGRKGTLPIRIAGGHLKAITYELDVPSAQAKAAVLLAGLFAKGRTTVVERFRTRNHTETMLPLFGVKVKKSGGNISIKGPARLKAADITVPGDFSAAAAWIAAACIIPGSRLVIKGVSLNCTRMGFVAVLKRMGARIKIKKTSRGVEPKGTIEVRHAPLSGVRIGREEIPFLIDEVPLLAVVASQAQGETLITGVDELRHKESDRLIYTAGLLGAMCARLRVLADGFLIQGPQKLKGSTIITGGDHRIAIAAAVAALAAEGETVIKNSESVRVSYPNFFKDLKKLSR
ncbi:MAG: 3-phosphoshikimate 1-carboxyvinyltransferase [bacterium]